MDDFFNAISKGVIIVPIVIVVLSLLMKFNQKNQPLQISPTPIPTVPVAAANKINLDLNGPLLCHYENNGQEYNLTVKNKKINLKTTADGQTKEYDLSSYAPIIENMLNMDINQLESLAKPYLPKGVDLKELINSCKRN